MQNNEYCYTFNSKNKISTPIKLQKDHMNGGFLPKPENTLYEDPSTIELKENETLIISNGEWTKKPLYIGCRLFHKTNKAEIKITNIGDKPADFPEYTDKPIPDNNYSYYYNYSEQQQNWVFDLTRYKDDTLRRVSSMCVEENYKMFPQYKRDNVYSGSPVTDNYPEYLKGEAGKQSIARLNAVYQNIAITAQTAIMSEEVQTPEAVDLIIKNIKFPTEEEILLQIQG